MIKLLIGKTLAPTQRLSKNLKLSILPRRSSGTYLDKIASLIGICPNTKHIAASIAKNNDQSFRLEAAKIKIIWPVEIDNKTNFGE